MIGDFVSFDDVRPHVDDLFEAHEIPTNFAPLYLVRNLFGRVGVTVSVTRERERACRDALYPLGRRLREKLGAHGYPVDDTVFFVEPDLLETLEEGA